MKPREKILAMTLVTVVAAFLGYQLVLWLVINPFRNLNNDLRRTADRKTQLENMVLLEANANKEWQARTARALSSDLREAQTKFYEDVSALLRKNGFSEVDTFLKNQPAKPQKNGLIEVPVSVTAKGSLKAVIGFLRDYYQQPYYTQVGGTLVLTPEEKYTGTKSEPSAADKNKGRPLPPPSTAARPATGAPAPPVNPAHGDDAFMVKMSFTATTLVLPKLPNVPSQPLDPNAPPDPKRLGNEAAAYDEIAQVNFFKKFVPKPVEPPAVAKGPDPPTENHRPPPPPQPDPRKDADKFHLVAVYTEDGLPVARVVDDRKKTQPPETYHVNDAVDFGTLVLIRPPSYRNPAGMVVRVERKEGDQVVETTDYFYALGKTFKDREKLDPALHSDVLRELRVVRNTSE